MRGRLGVLLLAAVAAGARAYTPGTGNLLTEGFQDGDDAGWATAGSGTLSRWAVGTRGGARVYVADGIPDALRLLPETARHDVHAVYPTSLDLCFEVVMPDAPGTSLRVDARPPRDDAPTSYRLTVTEARAIEAAWVSGATTDVIAATRAGLVASGVPTWLRLQVRAGAAGASDVAVRAWTGGAAAEPAAWDATGTTPGPERVPHVSRVEWAALQPAGVETWIDEIDVYGDTSPGAPSSIRTVWVAEMSHLDVGFTEPPDDVERFAKAHLDRVLANLRADAGYRWNVESAWWLLRWMERSSPAEVAEMMDALRAGRVRLMAGYANLHSTVATREELIRSVSYSHRMARAEGFAVRTFVQDDVPGASFAMPEILSKSGVDFYLGGMNTGFGGAVSAPSHAQRPFWWEGPDGSRVLSWITFDSYAEGLAKYGMSFFDNLARMHAALGLALPEQEGLGYAHANLLVMRAFDNHYQGRFVKDLVDQWNATYATPRLVVASPEEFFEAVQAEIATTGWTIPVYRGDFGSAWTHVIPGTAHTQAAVNEARRDAQAAEAFAAAAWVVGAPHPTAQLDVAWRRILEVDEHSGGGAPWPGYMTPEEADRQSTIHQGYAAEAATSAASALDASLTALEAQLDLRRGGVVVWNQGDAPRTGPVRVGLRPGLQPFRLVDAARGLEVPYQSDGTEDGITFVAEDVPGLGWKAYRLLPGTPADGGPGDLRVTGAVIENAFYRVTADGSDGSVSSLVHLPSGRELVDATAPWRFGQSASSTNLGVFFGAVPTADAPTSATVTVGDAGPVTASLVVAREGTPAARMAVRLWRGLDLVEIASIIDRDRFPFVPYADNSRHWAITLPFSLAGFDFATESPARLLRPASDGFARPATWATLNSTGVVAAEDALGTLVLASPEHVVSEWGGISFMLLSHRTDRAHCFLRVKAHVDEAEWDDGTIGPIDPEPGTSPLYPATVRLRALPPGADDATLRRAGLEMVEPLRARYVLPAAGALPAGGRPVFTANDLQARLFTVKRSDDGTSLVARLENLSGSSSGPALSSVFELSEAVECSMQEEAGAALPMVGGSVQVPLGAHGTTTVRVRATAAFAPTLLKVGKDEARRDVLLSWTGGVPAFRVLRSLSRDVASDTVVLDPAVATRALTDAGVLRDGAVYFYDVE
jgi:hypothetical protein